MSGGICWVALRWVRPPIGLQFACQEAEGHDVVPLRAIEAGTFTAAPPVGEPAGRVVDASREPFQGGMGCRLEFALEAKVELRADEADQGLQVGGDFDREALQLQVAERLADHVAKEGPFAHELLVEEGQVGERVHAPHNARQEQYTDEGAVTPNLPDPIRRIHQYLGRHDNAVLGGDIALEEVREGHQTVQNQAIPGFVFRFIACVQAIGDGDEAHLANLQNPKTTRWS